MRRLYHFFALVSILLTSCITDEVDYVRDSYVDPSCNDGIHIFGAVEDFDIKSVRTRADGDQPADSYISEMTMFVFDKNGDIVQGYLKRTVNEEDTDGNPTDVTFEEIDKTTSVINIEKANPTFLIDTKAGIIASLDDASPTVIYYDHVGDTNDLTECKIYIVANAWHALESRVNNITSIETLEQYTIPIDGTLAMPKMDDGTKHRGFPMIGTHAGQTFDLRYVGSNIGAVAKIPLKKLYSKVNFTMQVNATQVVAGQTPKFEIEKVEVFNVPTKARLGRDLDANGKPAYGDTNADDYINEIGNYYQFTNTGLSEEGKFTITNFNTKTIYHSASSTTDDVIEFGFYMPEHKVTPNTITYPTKITDEAKQYYKPLGVGAVRNGDGTTSAAKIATFVRIHGAYTDHNGQIKDVRYDIYLGQNNTDDFTVKRNQLLNNKLIITGLTNYHDAYNGSDNISIDHRVDVDYKGFNLSMERTAILDAHFEVRPLDIELSPGSTMTITIPETYRTWLAMESDAAAKGGSSDVYVNTTDDRKGVRKYFTTDLVSVLNANVGTNDYANGGTITLSHSGSDNTRTEIYRIWFYIDENPNVYDKTGAETPADGYTVSTTMYRNCPVEFSYKGTTTDNEGNTIEVAKSEKINFQQWNLWRVWSADNKRYYDIEHEEEYLNNYASDEQYGGTQNGMPFGLVGIQLSNQYPAAVLSQDEEGVLSWLINHLFKIIGFDSVESMANEALSKIDTHYDFYLQYDVNNMTDVEKSYLKIRNYSGIIFNREIAATLKASTDAKAKIDGITLTEDPKSAFAYCYHKNKRNSNGVVVEQKWFLPAIDEIEDIALGAYDEFDRVFQNQKYWSCQPAYEKRNMHIDLGRYIWREEWRSDGTLKGDYYVDDIDRARATSVYSIDGKTYSPISSSVSGYFGTQNGRGELGWQKITIDLKANGGYVPITIDDSYFIDHPGNLPRTQSCRIRAVYRSGSI